MARVRGSNSSTLRVFLAGVLMLDLGVDTFVVALLVGPVGCLTGFGVSVWVFLLKGGGDISRVAAKVVFAGFAVLGRLGAGCVVGSYGTAAGSYEAPDFVLASSASNLRLFRCPS